MTKILGRISFSRMGKSLSKAIFEPSGDQEGTYSVAGEVVVSCCLLLPSVFMAWMSTSKVPSGAPAKAIFVPAGDQAGLDSDNGVLVNCVVAVPSGLIMTISEPPPLVALLKTIMSLLALFGVGVPCPHAGNTNTNKKTADANIVRKYDTHSLPACYLSHQLLYTNRSTIKARADELAMNS